ncbi:hypothetical protein [Shimia sp. R9_3]|uniref:alginate O-acetyltransferase AlgX-related protein n=1 Tax=Shimia sp. R9_3 TaxID=2821113 RepID=UPI001ADCC91E|nr:hypothetical protein [Shimia sp. R9_3]MBO9401194.1 hypothetical protein [Shimia sp. R9_3]
MKHILAALAATSICATTAHAAPLCSEFRSPDTMPKKYRKLAPVLSGSPTDWVITADQMDTTYLPDAQAAHLLSQIASEFEARGTRLAILMAPPRPLIAGQSTLETLAKAEIDFDAAAVSESFTQMIELLRASGVVAPNLLEHAISDETLREAFYYRHDTHWTPRGAAESAMALAHEVRAAGIDAFADTPPVQPDLASTQVFSERGSLADMAKAVCGVELPPVTQTIPAFPSAETDLLADTTGRPRILLAGSSFSNRYKKDAYRVADAISGTLQADVINHSVSGGGAIGAIEGVINAGLLKDEDPFDLVIWELPYTEGLRSPGVLRQLLGALQNDPAKLAAPVATLAPSGKTRIDVASQQPAMMALHLPESTVQRIKIDLRFEDGTKQTQSMIRKKHVPAALRSDWWAFSLDGLSAQGLQSITLRYDGPAIGTGATAHFY